MPQVKCEYCGAFIDETADKCPNCGAVNRNFKRIVSDTPQTIEELQDWYRARNLPDENITRFFIGKNIEEPKAFGIYKDGSNYIVYKNKADGSRAVRYKGTDEAYAVNEIYLKLKSEILNQKSRSMQRVSRSSSQKWSIVSILVPILITFSSFVVVFQSMIPIKFILLMAGLFIGGLVIFHKKPLTYIVIAVAIIIACSTSYMIGYKASHRYDGYYFNGHDYYYRQGNDVYYYDNGWGYYDTYDDFIDYYPESTYVSDEYSYNENYTDFSDSYYYESNDSSSSSSSDWSSDSDYDWDSGSDWDSGGSDWDSDW